MIKCLLKRQMHTPQGLKPLEIDLEINKGEFAALYGDSGAGKTTVLRMLAGLTQPQEGYIEVDGEVWFDSKQGINRQVQQRPIGFVFQEHAAFPHMTVYQNIAFACRGHESVNNIEEWMLTMGLKGLENLKPDKLSGGQKQRLSLVRAIIGKPKILLLDEPLSDLDMTARLTLQDEMIKLHQQLGITTVLVSHDLAEVFRLSRKVFVLNGGKIIKSGSPQEIFVEGDFSGKFKFTGHVLEILKEGVVNILTLMIDNNITKVIASDEEITGITVGSKVMVAAKAFNPLILKI